MSKYRESIDREEFERIEQYLLHTMQGAERLAFEQAMQTNEALRSEVELQRMLMSGIELGAFHAREKTTRTSVRYLWYAAAALIAGVVIGGWWLYTQKLPRDDLYAAYFRPDTGLPVVMGIDSVQYLFNEGMVSYKEENYTDAIRVWEQLVAGNGASDTLQYYIGMAYLNSELYADASGYLSMIAADSQSVFYEKSIWYLALLALKDKEYAHAKSLLMQLPENEAARELLGRIKE